MNFILEDRIEVRKAYMAKFFGTFPDIFLPLKKKYNESDDTSQEIIECIESNGWRLVAQLAYQVRGCDEQEKLLRELLEKEEKESFSRAWCTIDNLTENILVQNVLRAIDSHRELMLEFAASLYGNMEEARKHIIELGFVQYEKHNVEELFELFMMGRNVEMKC